MSKTVTIWQVWLAIVVWIILDPILAAMGLGQSSLANTVGMLGGFGINMTLLAYFGRPA